MSYSSTPNRCQVIAQELFDVVDWSSKSRMENEDDLSGYDTVFWSLCDPLLASHYMSPRECEDIFWQGFHPNDRAKITPEIRQRNWDILQGALPQLVIHDRQPLALDVPPSAPDLVARAPVLPDVAPLTILPLSPPTLSRPKGPRRTPVSSTSIKSATPMPVHPSSVPPCQPPARSSSIVALSSPHVRNASLSPAV